jgi:hypothetical protein
MYNHYDLKKLIQLHKQMILQDKHLSVVASFTGAYTEKCMTTNSGCSQYYSAENHVSWRVKIYIHVCIKVK